MTTPTPPASRFKPAVISGLRFRSRHVHKTVAEFLEEKLRELGWVVPPVNMGTAPVTFKEVLPDANTEPVAPNTVSVSAGDVGEDRADELGAGVYELVIPIFVDVYGANASIAQSIAEDLKEQVSRGQIIPLWDWSNTSDPVPVEGSYIEFESAVGPERPSQSAVSQDFRRFWRTVKVEAHVYYGMDD